MPSATTLWSIRSAANSQTSRLRRRRPDVERGSEEPNAKRRPQAVLPAAMNPADAVVDIVDRLLTQLRPNARVTQPELRTAIRAFVGAWFQDYQGQLIELLGDEAFLQPLDEMLQNLQRLITDNRTTKRELSERVREVKHFFAEKLLTPASRAYWARAQEKSPAGLDDEVLKRLEQLDQNLAASYRQVTIDLAARRLSYRGTAGELREVLTRVLHTLAPTAAVEATDWYRASVNSRTRKEPTPTRAERVRYILRDRATRAETAEGFATTVEERLALVINATYADGSAQTHAGAEAGEVAQQLRYVNALLRDILPA